MAMEQQSTPGCGTAWDNATASIIGPRWKNQLEQNGKSGNKSLP